MNIRIGKDFNQSPGVREKELKLPLVSVVVPAFNASCFIDDCLDSVYAQTGSFNLDVIVVDDGSTDNTVSRVRSGGRALRCVKQPNRGPAAARNAALRLAQGDYIAFLDSDDLWPEGKLERQVKLLESNPDVGLVFGDCRQFDAHGYFADTLFQSSNCDVDFWGDQLYVVNAYAKLMGGNFITTGAVLMRRVCMDAVGVFDEGLRLVEDFEYWLRIALEYPLAHLDDICLLRRRHNENSSSDAVAMALAGLRVLEVHRRRYDAAARARGVSLRSCLAHDYQKLGHLYMRHGAHREAARAYLRGCYGAASFRSAYYFVFAVANMIGLMQSRMN